ncbi:hypothetical protein [Hymenobacter daeguensis]
MERFAISSSVATVTFLKGSRLKNGKFIGFNSEGIPTVLFWSGYGSPAFLLPPTRPAKKVRQEEAGFSGKALGNTRASAISLFANPGSGRHETGVVEAG